MSNTKNVPLSRSLTTCFSKPTQEVLTVSWQKKLGDDLLIASKLMLRFTLKKNTLKKMTFKLEFQYKACTHRLNFTWLFLLHHSSIHRIIKCRQSSAAAFICCLAHVVCQNIPSVEELVCSLLDLYIQNQPWETRCKGGAIKGAESG